MHSSARLGGENDGGQRAIPNRWRVEKWFLSDALVLGPLTSRENRHALGVSMGRDLAMIEEYQDLVENHVPEMRCQDDPWVALAADWHRGRWFEVEHARKHAALMVGVVPGEPLAD